MFFVRRALWINELLLLYYCNVLCRQSNFTLGLGLNRFNIYIVSSSSSADGVATESTKRILGLYTLAVFRQPISVRLPSSITHISLDDLTGPHMETSLWSCSLQQVRHKTRMWRHFVFSCRDSVYVIFIHVRSTSFYVTICGSKMWPTETDSLQSSDLPWFSISV